MKRWLNISLVVAAGLLFPGCSGSAGGDRHEEGEEHAHEHSHEGNEVELTKAQMDAVGIRLGGFEARGMSETIPATGELAVDARSEGYITPSVGGRVTRLLIAPGRSVRKGEVVAYIDAPELASLRGSLREARQELEAVRVELKRQEALAAQGAGVRKNLDSAKAAVAMAETRIEGLKGQLRALGASDDAAGGISVPVRSDVSGVVTEVTVPVGGYADMQSPIARVVDNGAVYCTLKVLEKDINSIKRGMKVEMQLTNDPSRSLAGKVEEINPVLDPESRTVPVKVSIVDSRDGLVLIPGMAVSAMVSTGDEAVTALPEGAVVSAGGRSYIFVLEEEHDGDCHFEKVEVSTGVTSLGYTAVTPLEELPEGAKVVVAGAFYLNSMISDHGEHNH